MQKYTELKFHELSDSFDLKMSDEWDKAVDSWSARGFVAPDDDLFQQIEDIGIKYLDKLLDELLSAEKVALSKDPTLPIDYYDSLKREMVQIAFNFLKDIFEKIDSFSFDAISATTVRADYHDEYEHSKQRYESRIRNKIDLMQEELRLKIVSHSGMVINVGGDIAVVNTGIVYGSIHGQIEKMKETSNADIAELFDKLLGAIKDSQISEEDKLEQMQNVELLVTQYETPPQKRNRGLISASTSFLSMAANLTTLWVQFGPTIIEAFKRL